jgi:hypothetical protein
MAVRNSMKLYKQGNDPLSGEEVPFAGWYYCKRSGRGEGGEKDDARYYAKGKVKALV